MTRITTLFTVVLVLTPLAAAQGDLEYRLFDVSGCVGAVEDAPLDSWELSISRAYRVERGERAEPVDEERRHSITVEALVGIIRDAVASESWEESGRQMLVAGNGRHLFVRQTREVLDDIARFLESLTAYARRGVDLEVLVVEGSHSTLSSALSGNGVLSAQRFESIRAGQQQGLAVVSSSSASAFDNQRVRVRSGRLVNFCADYDVEVAQSAVTPDPVVRDVFAGVDLSIRPVMTDADTINIRLQGAVVHGLELTPFETGSPSLGRLQLPECRTQKVTACGGVPSGDAIVVGVVGADDLARRFVLVRATARGARTFTWGKGDRVLRFYPTGFLTNSWLRPPTLHFGWANGGQGSVMDYPPPEGDDETENRFYGPDMLVDLIRTVVTPRYWEEEPHFLQYYGDSIVVQAGSKQHAGIREFLGRLSSTRAQFVTLETYVVTLPREILGSIRSSGGNEWLRQVLRSPHTRRRYSAASASELHSRIDWAAGREFAYVADYDAEIAQGATISSPRIETGFEGLYLRTLPYALASQGRYGLRFRLELWQQPKKTEAFDAQAIDHGRIQTPALDASVTSGDVPVSDKAYALLGEFTMASDKDEVTLVIARVRRAGPKN